MLLLVCQRHRGCNSCFKLYQVKVAIQWHCRLSKSLDLPQMRRIVQDPNMKTLGKVWIFITLYVSAIGESDVDFIDTDGVNDPEAALKCDACRAVTYKFAESFSNAQGVMSRTIALKDEEIVEAAEGTCDDLWQGYGSIKVNDEERLAGPGMNFDFHQDEARDDEGLWSRRLQDLCDELLAEVSDEKVLYNLWASDNSLEDYLCRGEGLFGACSLDFWGSWPGEDYEDYDDGDDFEYTHDEF